MVSISDKINRNPIPQLRVIRRVPMRYRQILPLTIMKQYHCIVVGAAQGVLTVAITDRQNMAVIESLSRFTRRAIFPVLIDPNRMRLLIRRIERGEQCRKRIFYLKGVQLNELDCCLYTLRRLEASSIVMLLTSQKARDSYT
jgi:hypothetical protein